MKGIAVISSVAGALVLTGCGGSKATGGVCITPRPSDSAIVSAFNARLNRNGGSTSIELLAVADCDADGIREIWYHRSAGGVDLYKMQLRHADNGKWYLVAGDLIEVSND